MPGKPTLAEGRIAITWAGATPTRPADDLIRKCVAWTWKVKLRLSLERDLFTRLREDAEGGIKVSRQTCAICCWPRRPASAW